MGCVLSYVCVDLAVEYQSLSLLAFLTLTPQQINVKFKESKCETINGTRNSEMV